jgi:hypothetical protein
MIARQLERAHGMEMINRSAIVVKPAQPFLDWLHRVDPTSAHLMLDDLRLDSTIYLLPECEGKEEGIEYLREVCTEIFEEQLGGWYRVPPAWPAERDLNTFLLWFEWSLHSMIIDLDDDLIEHEAM